MKIIWLTVNTVWWWRWPRCLWYFPTISVCISCPALIFPWDPILRHFLWRNFQFALQLVNCSLKLEDLLNLFYSHWLFSNYAYKDWTITVYSISLYCNTTTAENHIQVQVWIHWISPSHRCRIWLIAMIWWAQASGIIIQVGIAPCGLYTIILLTLGLTLPWM